jgi:dipeptidyl aminopeptidase/acylaminoacyl peptidase
MKNFFFTKRISQLAAAAGLISVLGLAPLAAQTFSLESLLSAGFPSDLVVSPRGDAVAWAFDDQGRRNVWIARAPDFKAHALTKFSQDEGLEISSLVFNHDGSVLVFVRNQGMNRAGEYPNPTSNPQGAEQAVWAVKAAGGDPWKVGQGADPVASPTENIVVYAMRGKLFFSSLDGTPKPQALFTARGSAASYSFAPNGSCLAFASDRGDHSFIGAYDLKAKTITWASPSVDRDVIPAWSLDGKQLAFLRFPGGAFDVSDVDDSQLTYSIMVADAATGTARQVWRSPKATGGFAQTYFPKPLTWVADGRLVFYSEHEGWMHLYSLNPAEGRVTCLTPGDFEVEDSCFTRDLRTVVFNSNQGDIDRRHLWAVPVSGGTPKILTPGSGLEWAPRALAGDALAFLCSTATEPAAPAVMDLNGRERRLIAPELIPADFPQKYLIEPQPVIFKSPDGLDIHGQLFLPRSLKPGDRRPAAIFMHGGPIRQMLLGFHYMHYYHNSYAFNQYLASRGYVVLSVNYRLGIGYGRAFREAAKGGARGASEYQDIVAAGKYLRSRSDVDSDRIGLWGGSYGGYLTALGLARNSELFAAGVDLHGVHDWSTYWREFAGTSAGAQAEEAKRVAFESSPVSSLDFWTSPVLFIHGDDDRNVEFSQTTDLVKRLRNLGKAHLEILVFPDEIHDFLRHATWLKAYHAAADFFDRMLKK